MVGSVGEFLDLREKMEGNEMIGEDGGEGVEGSVGGWDTWGHKGTCGGHHL